MGTAGEPVSTLRGAGAGSGVDARMIGRIVVGLVVVALAVLVVVLVTAGVDKNDQISQLRHHGVVVDIRVTGCLGLLGGSGSNAAGYACRGSFTLDGHRENEAIPGNVLRAPGTRVRGVSVPGDPALVTTVRALAGEHASGRVFILPAILAVVLVVLVATLVLRRRRPRRT